MSSFYCCCIQVFGVGIPNPYRLRPYLGARVPINSSFTPVIQMHNPYSTRIQVCLIFSSHSLYEPWPCKLISFNSVKLLNVCFLFIAVSWVIDIVFCSSCKRLSFWTWKCFTLCVVYEQSWRGGGGSCSVAGCNPHKYLIMYHQS